MNFEDARAAIFARINTGWTGSAYAAEAVEYENRKTVDRNAAAGPFLAVELVWADGEQVELGDDPLIRYHGSVYTVVYVREGSGSAVSQVRLGYLAGLLGAKSFGGVTTQASKPVPAPDVPGWLRYALRTPFFFNSKP